MWGFGRPDDGEKIEMQVIQGEWDLPRMLGMELVDGRFFLESEQGSEVNKMLINETAQRRYNLEVGQVLPNGTIVGVIKDFNFSSLRQGIEPMCFMVTKHAWLMWMYVRTSGDPVQAVNYIKNVVASVDPTYPTDVQFYDSVYDTLYQKERKTTGLVTIFSLLAVIISLVGVFGLVMFETQYRRKEIGVRKVMGASVKEILAMFNKRFVWIVAICFVLAAPAAWYGIRQWLSTFAYRTPMYWWVFALSLVVVMLITLTTVTIQSWRAAVANPVDSLRTE